MMEFSFRTLICLGCLHFLFHFCSGATYNGQRIETDFPNVETETGLEHSDRQSKNLFPFVWVTFKSSPCGINNEGACVQRGKCMRRGGNPSGECQDGFGECCVFTEQCTVNRTRVDVNQLVTRLKSPTPIDTQCSYRFKKEPNICQILLQFTSYISAGAAPDGNCGADRLRITGSVTVDDTFVTCGTLTQQHMYLTFGSQDTIDVTPIVRSMNGNYDITATRIACDSTQRAPDYCLQYFTTGVGTVRSFDFMGQQQNNQRYTICVRPTPQSTDIRWGPCPGVNGAMDISSPSINGGTITCERDWIQPKGENRICEGLTGTVQSAWKPYEVLVNFDATEFPDPPAFFTRPITGECSDAAGGNCATDSVPGLVCGCFGTTPPMSCQCTMDLTTMPGAISWAGDFNNTGFCLNYTQF